MLRPTALVSTLALSLAGLSACSLPRLDAMARYGQYGLDGDIAISSSGASASNDIDTLGLDDTEGAAGAVVDFKWGMPHLSISTQSTSYSGDGTLDADISFDGNTIDAGTDVASDLDLDLTTGVLTFDVLPGPVELGLGFGVTLVGFDMKFVEDGTGETVDTDERAPIPVLAARAGMQFGSLEVGGLLSGMSVNSGDVDASLFDLDLFGRWNFIGGEDHLGGSLVLGWREVNFDVDYEDGDDDVNLDLGYSGPYIGLLVRF